MLYTFSYQELLMKKSSLFDIGDEFFSEKIGSLFNYDSFRESMLQIIM